MSFNYLNEHEDYPSKGRSSAAMNMNEICIFIGVRSSAIQCESNYFLMNHAVGKLIFGHVSFITLIFVGLERVARRWRTLAADGSVASLAEFNSFRR
jgi:hypothetical protein